MVTLKDIAREAGVSVMMVSRVVNRRYNEVSQENIDKIQAIIQKLGYIPDSSARSLSSNSSKIISVIIQGIDNPMASPYNANMLGHIISLIQARGYNAMVHFIDDYAEVTKHLRSWKSEGAIFLGTFDENIRQIQEDNQIPLIFTDSYSSVRQFINIGIDDYKGGVLAAGHFLKNGHRDFAVIAPHLHVSQLIQQRVAGFCDTAARAGFAVPPEHILEPYDFEEATDRLCALRGTVTAVFAATDICAIQLISLLKKRGRQVPEDYSLIGFDNLLYSAFSTPALTTIAQNIGQKARYAVDTLFHYLEDSSLPARSVVLDVELIERDSVKTIVRPQT